MDVGMLLFYVGRNGVDDVRKAAPAGRRLLHVGRMPIRAGRLRLAVAMTVHCGGIRGVAEGALRLGAGWMGRSGRRVPGAKLFLGKRTGLSKLAPSIRN